MKKTLPLLLATVGILAGPLIPANAFNIVSNDVSAILWPSGAPYTFFDAASTGGGDTAAATSINFDRSFGTLNVGANGCEINIRGIGWASAGASSFNATNVIATITYFGADGTNGGGDDVILGRATNNVTANSAAGEWVWVFDSPIIKTIDGLSNVFRINLAAVGTGTMKFKTTGTGTQPASAAKISVAGASTPYSLPTALDRVWQGNLSGTWDTGALNWTNLFSGTAANYANGTQVIFDDTLAAGPLNTNITLSTTHTPLSVTFNNSSYDYTLSGGGLAGTMTLRKYGARPLTLNTANSYFGGSTLAGGVVRLGHAAGLGTGPVSLSGGRLSSDGATPRTVTNTLTFSGGAALGDTVNNGALTFSGPVNYGGAADLAIGSPAIFTGNFTNGGLDEKTGAATLTYSGVTSDETAGQWQIENGDFVINGGTLTKGGGGIRIGNTSANGVSRLVITNGAQVLMTGSGLNARVGNDAAPAAAASSTNILDVSGTLAWQQASAGAVFMGPNGAFAQVNLRAGGLLRVGGFTKGGTTVTEFNFLGGTLGASRDNTSFMTGLGAANISTAAGAIIDSGVYTITIGQSLNDPLASGGGVIKKGSGTLNFSGGGSYSGATVVQQGTLLIGSSHPFASAVIVSNNAAIGASVSAPATIPNLTLNGSRVVADYGNAGSGTTMTVSGGPLNLSSINTVELTGINLALGTYTVLAYTSKTGAGSFSPTPILPPGVSGTVTDTGSAIQVTITATVTTRTWYGYDNGVFTLATSWDTTSSAWDIGSATYADGLAVLFNETRFGGENTNINITTPVSPLAVTVNNSSSTYSFNSDSGAGIAGPAVLLKTGVGRLDINSVNTYSGATAVNGGTLGGTGVISGPVIIGAAAVLSPGTSVVSNTIGTLTISNSLALNGDVVIGLDKSAVQSNDVVKVTGALSYGGTLTPVNIATNAFVAGDSFAVFPPGGSGSISVVGSPGAGLIWNFNTASGVLSVASTTLSPTPLNYANLGGGVLQFSWTGAFKLQWQTNAAAVGLQSNWVDYPNPSNPVNVTNNPAVASTFFRLINQ